MRMKRYLFNRLIVLPVLGLTVFAALSGCGHAGGNNNSGSVPAEGKPLWEDIRAVATSRAPSLELDGGDLVMEGFGQLVNFYPLPEEESQMFVLDWQDDVLGFYTLDLHDRSVTDMGGLQLKGPLPTVQRFSWPWVLVQSSDSQGNFSWVLIDLSGGQAEVAWQSFAWVPQGLRRRPVWQGGDTWYLGPITGPFVTDILTGEIVSNNAEYNYITPVGQDWPRWAGGVSGSDWYMPPVDGGVILAKLKGDSVQFLEQNGEWAWNQDKTRAAWCHDSQLGLLKPGGAVAPLDIKGAVPGAPLWSMESDKLYFLGGEADYFGTSWKRIYVWEEETGTQELFTLPGKWARWRILAATDEAVLASAGDGECLIYGDVSNDKLIELSGVQQWTWQEGNLVALSQEEMIRISAGFDPKVLIREIEGVELHSLVDQFVIFTQDGKTYIRQLVM